MEPEINNPERESIDKGSAQAAKQRTAGNRAILSKLTSGSSVATWGGFVLLGLLSIFFWQLGERFEAHKLVFWASWSYFAMFTLGLAGIGWLIFEWIGYGKLIVALLLAACVLIAILVFAPEKPLPPSPKKPPLGLFVVSAAAPDSKLWLTNASLFWTNSAVSSQFKDILVVPTIAQERNSILKFWLDNHSPELYEALELALLVDTNMHISFSEGWTKLLPMEDGRIGAKHSGGAEVLHGYRGYPLPPIKVEAAQTVGFVTVQINAKDMNEIGLGFWIAAGDFGERRRKPFLAKTESTESSKVRFHIPQNSN